MLNLVFNSLLFHLLEIIKTSISNVESFVDQIILIYLLFSHWVNYNLYIIFEAIAISFFNSLNTCPGYYNISPYLSKSILNK